MILVAVDDFLFRSKIRATARQAEVEAGLKAQMIERGMSADEIELVISGGRRSE